MRKIILLAAVILVAAHVVGCEKKERPYSVLLITVSSFGREQLKGPTFDKLVKEGAIFDDAVTPSPVTTPALVSLMTGLHPIGHGVLADRGYVLDGKAVTLGEAFQTNGNRTSAFVGSTELDMGSGLEQGWDSFGYKFDSVPEGPLPQVLVRPAAELVKDAKGWITAFGDKPFLMWVHLGDLEAGSTSKDDTVKAIDAAVGELLAAMPGKGTNTFVVIASTSNDAAGAKGEHGHGLFVYEKTIRVPVLFSGPNVKAGVFHDAISLEDVLPTICSFVGMKIPATIQGRDLSPVLKGGKLEGGENERVILTYAPYFSWGWSPLIALKQGTMKYIRAPMPELYDLKTDPDENTNLATQKPQDVAKMDERLKQIEARLKLAEPPSKKTTTIPDPTGTLPDPKDRFAAIKYVEEGAAAMEAKDYAKAIASLEQADAADPTNRRIPYLFARSYLASGNNAKALEYFEKAVERMPGTAPLNAELGDAYMNAGAYDKAIKAFEDALSIDPRMPAVYVSLGYLYPKLGETLPADVKLESMKKGLAYLITAVKLGDEDPKTYFNIGVLAYEIGRSISLTEPAVPRTGGTPSMSSQYFKSAAQAFNLALEKDPNLADAHLALGRLLAGDPSQREEAIKHLEAYLAASPNGAGAADAKTMLKNLGK